MAYGLPLLTFADFKLALPDISLTYRNHVRHWDPTGMIL